MSPETLQNHLPAQASTVVFIDVAALSRAGILARIAGPPGAQEPDYVRFVEDSGFDYQRDLRSVLIGVDGETAYILGSGSFDWTALRNYAQSQNGACRFSVCRMPAYGRNRAISWAPLRNDLIAFVSGPDQWGVTSLINGQKTKRAPVRVTAPVWLTSTGKALRALTGLPDGARTFTRALEAADRILLTIDPGVGADFELRLDADCIKPDVAARIAGELKQGTSTLNELLLRESRQPNPADLSGVLSAGTFEVAGQRVTGRWPLARPFVETLLVQGK